MATSMTTPTGPPQPGGGGGFGATGATGISCPPTHQDVVDFLNLLEGPNLSIEGPISECEANQAITLFSVVNLLLGGTSQQKVGGETKTDVLGMLTLYYSLQDKTLTPKIVVRSAQLWVTIEDELKALRDDLEILGS